jgi:sigma-B regulation protein RsbU (phosphoserine phosphatase)
MRIRVKLTLLLLAFALVPMVTVEVVDRVALARLAGRVDQQVSDNVTRRIEQELGVHVSRTAEQMRGIRSRVMMMTRTQAAVVADTLAEPPPATPARTHRSADFDALTPGEIPLGWREQPGWPAGTRPAPVVSYDRIVLVPPPGAAADPDQSARLASLTEELTALSADLRPSIRSQFIALADGTHAAYPAKGGYAGYDPRTRPWFLAATSGDLSATGGVAWAGPYRDAITGEPRLTASAPVRAPDGSLLAVTGVDFALRTAVDLLELPAELSLGSVAWVVAVNEQGGERGSVLLATRSGVYADDAALPPGGAFDEILAALKAGRGGSRPVELDAQPGIAVFGPIGPTAGLIMIVPRARVDALIGGVRADLRSIALESFRSLVAASIIVVLLCLLGAYLTGRTISRPIRRLADASQSIREGDLSARVEIRPRGDELGKLARAFNDMVPALADRMRLRESVALATEIQQSLLPAAAPSIAGFDIFGIAEYCDETGGDYFDYLKPIDMGEGRYGLALGDVTGHGIPAALIMTSARALLQSHARRVAEPHEILKRMNESIARESTHGKFMTFVLLVLDQAAGTLEAANAGHDPALVLRSGSGAFEEFPVGGLPLGVVPDESYETVRVEPLAPGDVLLVGTDGIWETRDTHGELYGKQRLRELVRAHAGGSAESMGREILADLSRFRGNAPVLDDITFIIAKATG